MQEKCPTCGSRLKNGIGAFQIRHRGEPVFFCGLECMRFCRQHPEMILDQKDVEIQTLSDNLEEPWLTV